MTRITLGNIKAEVYFPKKIKRVNHGKVIEQYLLLSFNDHLEEIYTFSKICEDYLQAMVVKYVTDTYGVVEIG